MFTLLNNKFLKKDKFFVFLFFFGFALLGALIFDDYGIAYDENVQRYIGLNNYDYIINLFQGEKIQAAAPATGVDYPHYGVAFELPLILIEKIFAINNIENVYLFRHFFIFFITIFGHVTFFLLLKNKFSSTYLSLFGCFILIISPRFFAEGFYNSKDIIFMHSFIICTFFGLKFLKRPDLINSFLFALLTALSANVRLVSLLIPIVIFYFIIIKFLRNDYKFSISFNVFTYLFFLFFLLIFFWPFLWTNTIDNFLYAFFTFKNYDIDLTNFYAGKYMSAQIIDWYYLPLWIIVTTPFYILFFFILNFLKTIQRIIKRMLVIDSKKKFNDLWRGNKELHTLIFFSFIFISIFSTIIFKSTLYNGWRHFYFIYPFIVILALSEIRTFFHLFKKLRKFLLLFLFVSIIFQINWMVVNHPHQYVYFNFIGGKKPHLNYEIDYWGLSNKYALIKILSSKQKNEMVTVSNVSDTNLNENLLFSKIPNKKTIIYKDLLSYPDYVVDNNYFFSNKHKKKRKILKNYYVFDQLYVGDTLVTTIYKRK